MSTSTQETSGSESKSFVKGVFEPLNAGDYMVRMNRIEEKETRNNGLMLSAGFEVVNGPMKGRLVFHNFIVENQNPAAVKIGTEQLDKYLASVGAGSTWNELGKDITELQNYLELPFIATLGIEDEKEYTDRNGVARVAKAKNKITSFKAR